MKATECNNEGALAFSYNLEDTDTTAGGADVYNGQQSVLWVNLRQAFSGEIMAMYRTLRSTGALSYAKVEQMFETHQAKWGEAIFNEDAYFKYLAPLIEDGSGAYLAMLQGSKAEQRKWWLYNRFRYIDSKYNAGDALSDVIQLRGYAKADITVTPYADVYPSVKYGSYLVQTRGARNTASTLVCPLDSVNDTEIYIYSASQLASVGDLSGLKVGFADFSKATRLQSIKLGDASGDYENGNLTELTLGNNTLLRTVDVRNCTALGTGDQKSVDLSGCGNIEHAYFDGTTITGVELPSGGVLKTLHLPGTTTNLTLRNQTALTDLTIPSYANISTLWLENATDAVDIPAIVDELAAASRVRIIGFDIELASGSAAVALLEKLADMRGLDESGGNTQHAQLSGTIAVGTLTNGQLSKINAMLEDNGWTDVTVVYTTLMPYTTATPLFEARRQLAGASVGNYALAMGGYASGYVNTDKVDAYDTSLTRKTATELSVARGVTVGVSVGNYALAISSDTSRLDVVDAYDTSLTRTVPTPLSVARRQLAGASVGNYALAMGGESQMPTYSTVVNAYDTSLTRKTATGLSVGRYDCAGASVGNYALCMGGYNGSYSSTVDAYDTSLTRATASSLSEPQSNARGASVGNYALCMGRNSSTAVDAYDTSLTRTSAPSLSSSKMVTAASTKNHAWAMGGYYSNTYTSVVETYDASLTKTVVEPLPSARGMAGGVGLGSLAFCMGGYDGTNYLDSVIVYED